MAKRFYTKSHEWIDINGDTATVGITDYAQHALGDVVYVEIPASGKVVTIGDSAAVVESVKAASEVYAPVSGTIIEGNPAIQAEPALVNRAADTEGWFFRLKIANNNDLNQLLNETEYKNLLASLA